MAEEPCAFLIKQINDALEKQANNALRDQGMTMAQVTVLMYLDDQSEKTASLKALEKFLGVAQSTAAGIVSRLEQKGYVVGFGDPADKRIKMIKITSAGEQCCANSQENRDLTEERLTMGFGKEEKEAFRMLLQKARDSVK